MAAPNWPLPRFGDLVWCRFPFGGQPTNARHPCLVIDVYVEVGRDPEVLLIGGTSANKNNQWTRTPKPSDFLLQGAELQPAGLSNPTVIQFEPDAITTLPWNGNYFVAVFPKSTPIMGRINLANNPLKAAFQNAGRAANLKNLIETEQARVQAARARTANSPSTPRVASSPRAIRSAPPASRST
jgi:hypothetical protein